MNHLINGLNSLTKPGSGTLVTESIPPLEAAWARSEDEIRAAQRLRYEVFVGEMGATLAPSAAAEQGLDVDHFDAYCEHLLVRTEDTEHSASEVVGTYRVLLPQAALRAGRLYSDLEFNLGSLDPLRPELAELGRSCVHHQWRHGGVIMMLWASLARLLHSNGVRYAVGCASVPMKDGGHAAASLWKSLSATHLASETWRVQPRLALPVEQLDQNLEVEVPPLIKGYLRCGAKVLGPPAWDPEFGVADLPMLLDLHALPTAYRRRFIQG